MPTGVSCALPAIWASSPGRRSLDFHSPEPFHRESLDETDEGTQREPSHELRALSGSPCCFRPEEAAGASASRAPSRFQARWMLPPPRWGRLCPCFLSWRFPVGTVLVASLT